MVSFWLVLNIYVMAIKNKDGSPFTLRKPNPIMKEQDIWTNFQVHNLKFKDEAITEDITEVVPHDFQIKDFVSELEATKPLEKQVIVLPDLMEKEEKEKKPVFYCLPAVIRQHRDALYGETYSTIKYDTPFTFEAYVTEQSDLVLEFWTSADKISEGSVIYPKIMEKRWWRVVSKEVKEDGWLYRAIPSDYQPNFK